MGVNGSIDELILEILSSHGSVSLPTVGTLRTTRVPAAVVDGDFIEPPRHVVEYSNEIIDEALLPDVIARTRDVSLAAATERFNSWLDNVSVRMGDGTRYVIDGVGRLNILSEGAALFTMDDKLRVLLNPYGHDLPEDKVVLPDKEWNMKSRAVRKRPAPTAESTDTDDEDVAKPLETVADTEHIAGAEPLVDAEVVECEAEVVEDNGSDDAGHVETISVNDEKGVETATAEVVGESLQIVKPQTKPVRNIQDKKRKSGRGYDLMLFMAFVAMGACIAFSAYIFLSPNAEFPDFAFSEMFASLQNLFLELWHNLVGFVSSLVSGNF